MRKIIDGLFFIHRYRYFFMVAFVLVLVFGLSKLIAVTGNNTIFDSNSPAYSKFMKEQPAPEGVYPVADSTSKMLYATKKAVVQFGAAVYRGGDSVSSVGENVGSIASGAVGGIKDAGTATTKVPGKVGHAISQKASVSALIEPAAYSTQEIPVITESATSTEMLTALREEQRKEIERLIAEQFAANHNLAGVAVTGDAARGGYPAKWDNARQDSLVDDWGMYNRECVSYAAWKVHQRFGNMPYWGGIGNANQWLRNARNAGIPTSALPKVHSVAISMRGYYGHAMWVEKVQGDMIYVSQYNYDLDGRYSEMWLKASDFTYIYFQ